MSGEPRDDVETAVALKYTPSPAPAATFIVRVIEGVDAGASLTLDGRQPARALVGTSPVCDLRLTDREVSRRHAALEVEGRRLLLTDLQSTNGTRVGELAVGQAHLEGGEIVTLGQTRLTIDVQPGATDIELPAEQSFGRMLGWSREMRRLYGLCARIAASDVPAIIEGETGTGKEILAEVLHEQGPRADKAFLVFDCTAVAPSLVESELFGHERGAFTGAVSTRRGIFELADGGTVLIDEIGDLDPALQPRLLRVLERGEIRRVGATKPFRVDVRVLAATRRDLDEAVAAGRFRDDLFHRLAVARIELPPLRRRKGDVALLAAHFAKQMGGTVPATVVTQWESHPWPGNVRELRNAVARYLALGQTQAPPVSPPADIAAGEDLVAHVLRRNLPLPRARQIVIDEFERRYVERVLEEHGGNVTRAAAASGIGRRYFHMIRAKAR